MFSGKIFRSRWSALFWAAGIVWTAYDVASANSPPANPGKAATHHPSTNDSDTTAQDSAILRQFIGGN